MDQRSATLVYRGADSPKGKVWKIAVTDEGNLLIEYGAQGSALRKTHVPPSRFNQPSPEGEMRDRIDKKCVQGYVLVEGDRETPVDPVPDVETADRPALGASSENLGTWFF